MDCGLSPDHHLQERGQGPPGASAVRGRPVSIRRISPAWHRKRNRFTASSPTTEIYCLYLADNAEAIREHARRGGFPADHVALVRALIDPTTGEHLSRANSHRLCRCQREHTLGSRQRFDPSATMRAAHHQVFPAPPSTHDKGTAMHPTISHYLATARAAELRSQAQRDALARAARQARTHKLEHAAPRLAAAGRRLLTSLRPAAPDQPPASPPRQRPTTVRVPPATSPEGRTEVSSLQHGQPPLPGAVPPCG